ncbi:MAG: hypothetical protein ABI972_28385 [Acidobacteriota bacterium]
MAIQQCRVIVEDADNFEHSVVVTAESLYEAVALGIDLLRKNGWVGEMPAAGVVRVRVEPPPVEHMVDLRTLKRWVELRAKSPRDVAMRSKVKQILGW